MEHHHHLGAWSLPGGGPAARQPAPTSYSIKREFSGATVFMTGASGYIGSVLLEQLLRTTDVAAVYLLLRPRRGVSTQQRADALLQGALFHKIREQSRLLEKVKVVGGDISLPGLGLSVSDRATLVSSVNIIVHCAADIRLEADIQETLNSNYEGTRTVLELAAASQQLRGLVHVSSAFVNMNMPRGSIIDEAVYPLRLGNQVVDVEQLAKEFMQSPKVEANQRAETYKQLWNFPNTYTLGKHMSEQLVTRYQAQLQLPIAIVRPSLTCAIAGEPYPGYIGNWAGPIGAAAAMAIGMFDSVSSIASQPTGVWDIVPADMVASSILAAAAAVSAGAAVAVSRMTQSGTIKGSSAERRVVMGYPHPLSAASQLAAVVPQQLGATAGLRFRTADLTAKIQVVRTSASAASYKPRHGDDDAPSSADTHADQDQHFIRQGPTHALLDVDEEDSSSSSPKLLARAGDDRRSRSSTDDSGSNSGSSSSRSGSSRSSVADGPVSSVDDGAQHHHGYESGRIPLLVVHAASSSTYPLVLMEGWNLMLDFLDAHPPPFRITWGKLGRMSADFEPSVQGVMAARRRVGWKVWGLAGLMRLMGREKEARKLEVGFDAFCVQNNSKTDRQLVFSTHALTALEAALDPTEAADYLLVWRPVTNRPDRQTATAGGKEGGAAAAAAAAAPGGVLWGSSGRSENALAPVAGDVTWRRYLNTQMASVYKLLFGVEVQQRQLTAAAAVSVAAAGGAAEQKLPDEHYILHDYVRIK